MPENPIDFIKEMANRSTAIVAQAEEDKKAEWWRQLRSALEKIKESLDEASNIVDNLQGQGLAGTEAMEFFWGLDFPEDEVDELSNDLYRLITKVEDELIPWVDENEPVEEAA